MNRTAASRLIALQFAAVATAGIFAASVMSNSNNAASDDAAGYGSSITAQHISGHP
jgi:hypothetical protein